MEQLIENTEDEFFIFMLAERMRNQKFTYDYVSQTFKYTYAQDIHDMLQKPININNMESKGSFYSDLPFNHSPDTSDYSFHKHLFDQSEDGDQFEFMESESQSSLTSIEENAD